MIRSVFSVLWGVIKYGDRAKPTKTLGRWEIIFPLFKKFLLFNLKLEYVVTGNNAICKHAHQKCIRENPRGKLRGIK